jgi:hypothetical protein
MDRGREDVNPSTIHRATPLRESTPGRSTTNTAAPRWLDSSVDGSEVRSGLAKVISLAGFRRARDATETGASGDADEAGGDPGGDREEEGLTMQAG